MDLSIVIPLGKIDLYLEEALGSCWINCDNNLVFEIIIVADKGYTKELRQSISQKHKIRIFENEGTDQGPGICRNIGITKARGEYILFLDADDMLNIENISKAVVVAKGNNADIIEFDYDVADKYLTIVESEVRKDEFRITRLLEEERYIRLLRGELRDEAILQLYKKEFLKSSNAKFRDGVYEDIEFRYNTLKDASRILEIDDVCYTKRIHNGSITSKNNLPRRRKEYMKAIIRIRELTKSEKEKNALLHRVIGFAGLIAREILAEPSKSNRNVKEFLAIYQDWQIEKVLKVKSQQDMTEREELCAKAINWIKKQGNKLH